MSPRDFIMESITSLRLAWSEAWKAVRQSDDMKGRRARLQLVAQIEGQSTKLVATISLYGRAGDRSLEREAVRLGENVQLIQRLIVEMISGDEAN